MPSPVSTFPPGATPRGILLVEEYPALAVAISSALKKFAPLHALRVAHSLAEAEAIAAEMNPELFVLDLDPPPGGDVEFLMKLQRRFPESRALVIAAGTSHELRAERGTSGAVQFIEKPFDLGGFGAAVQALLGRWATPPSDSFRGTLRDLHVVDVVQLKCLALSTAVVRLETPDGRTGEIHFHHGEICHATTGDRTGVAAFQEIVRWPGGKISEADVPEGAPKTIEQQPWAILLLQAVRKAAEHKQNERDSPAASPAPSPPKPGKKILVIDDTEMLLIFAADVLGTADSSFEIATAASGGEGLETATKMRPDLILLDYSLTDVTGADVCRELLLDETTARIPVLMMSGHLPELANTAATYGNVVATLPKPFLSGALINAVEKILASGPLPKAPAVPPLAHKSASVMVPSTVPPPTPAALPPSTQKIETQPAPETSPSPPAGLANGKGHGKGNGHVAKGLTGSALVAPPLAPAAFRAPPQYSTEAIGAPASKEMSVTFSLEVLAVQLTPTFQLDSLRLAPTEPLVVVRVAAGNEIGLVVHTGFRMGPIQLTPKGEIETLLLLPTEEKPQLKAAGKAFVVSGVRAQPADDTQVIELTGAKSQPMRIHLTGRFEFLTVELSPRFEVVGIIFRAREEMAQLGSGPGSATAPFKIERTQLDATNCLAELFVRAVR